MTVDQKSKQRPILDADDLAKEIMAPREEHWDAARIRARLREAMDVVKRLPMPKGGVPSRLRALWPVSVGDDPWTFPADPTLRVRAAFPSPSELDRMDEAFSWLLIVTEERMRRAVVLRAVPLSFRRIGRLLGISHERARQLEAAAIDLLTRSLRKTKLTNLTD